MVAGNGTTDFAWRGRILRRLHLLDADQPSEFSKYVDEVFYDVDLCNSIVGVLRKVGFEGYYRLDEVLRAITSPAIAGTEWVVRGTR